MRLPLKSLVPMLLLLGAAFTAELIAFERMTRQGVEREAVLRQHLRAKDLGHQIKTGLFASGQVAHTVAKAVVPVADDLKRQQVIEAILHSAPADSIVGVGIWPEPPASPGARRLDPLYARREQPGMDTSPITFEELQVEGDYRREPWYQRAREARGAPVFLEPHSVGPDVWRVHARTIHDEAGALMGVVTVDLWLPNMRELVVGASVPGEETAFITTPQGRVFSYPEEQRLLEWARARGLPATSLRDLTVNDVRRYETERDGDTRHMASVALEDIGWAGHVSSSLDWLFASARNQQNLLLLLGVTFWSVLITGPLLVQRALTVRELSRLLEQRRRMHKQLERSERTLRDVLETSLDAVIAVDAGGTVVEWNAQAERTLGWRKDEVLGHPVGESLLAGDEGSELRRMVDSKDASPVHRRTETQVRRRGGDTIPVEVATTSVHADGLHRCYLFLSDITERKQAERERHALLEQLRRRSSELRTIIDTMVDSVVVSDAEGHITFVNKAGLQLFGELGSASLVRDSARIIHQYDLRTPTGRPLRPEEMPILRALRGNIVVDADLAIPAPEQRQTLYLRTNAAPIRDDAGQVIGAVAVVRDITETVELDHLKDEFVRVAAHELKTPVAIMKSYAQLALKRDPTPQTYRKMLDAITRGADRIDHIVRELLDVSQLQLGRLKLTEEPLDMRELAEETVGHMAALTQRHHLHVEPGPPVIVRGDRGRLRQVLVVLLDNAVRYSPDGGHVEVSLSPGDEAVEVCVSDDGIGIPSERQARLFERFYRAHSGTPHDRGGMGVGLYISREIIFRHGGTMRVSSQEGQGSTFCFSVPYAVRRVRDAGRQAPVAWNGGGP